MRAGTEDKASAWAEALERPTPGASKEGRTNTVPCPGAEHLLPGLPLLPRLHVSKGQETLSKAHPGRLSHLDGGGHTASSERSPCHPALAAPYPTVLCLHAVPAVHGGGLLRPCRAARSPLQQDPLLPGPVSTARGPPVVVQGLQGITGSEEGKAISQILG